MEVTQGETVLRKPIRSTVLLFPVLLFLKIEKFLKRFLLFQSFIYIAVSFLVDHWGIFEGLSVAQRHVG